MGAVCGALSACGGDESTASEATGGSSQGAAAGAAAGEIQAPQEPALVAADPPSPAGYTFGPSTVSGLTSTQVPTGEGWTTERMGAGAAYGNEELGVTVVLQQQANIPPEARDEYVDSFVEVNQRDAPGYAVGTRTNGTVSGHPATRVDGQFNNGQVMVPRDMVLFLRGRVVVVMVRGPEARLAEVQGVADYVASTLQ